MIHKVQWQKIINAHHIHHQKWDNLRLPWLCKLDLTLHSCGPWIQVTICHFLVTAMSSFCHYLLIRVAMILAATTYLFYMANVGIVHAKLEFRVIIDMIKMYRVVFLTVARPIGKSDT